jgi:hypothetical protein
LYSENVRRLVSDEGGAELALSMEMLCRPPNAAVAAVSEQRQPPNLAATAQVREPAAEEKADRLLVEGRKPEANSPHCAQGRFGS